MAEIEVFLRGIDGASGVQWVVGDPQEPGRYVLGTGFLATKILDGEPTTMVETANPGLGESLYAVVQPRDAGVRHVFSAAESSGSSGAYNLDTRKWRNLVGVPFEFGCGTSIGVLRDEVLYGHVPCTAAGETAETYLVVIDKNTLTQQGTIVVPGFINGNWAVLGDAAYNVAIDHAAQLRLIRWSGGLSVTTVAVYGGAVPDTHWGEKAAFRDEVFWSRFGGRRAFARDDLRPQASRAGGALRTVDLPQGHTFAFHTTDDGSKLWAVRYVHGSKTISVHESFDGQSFSEVATLSDPDLGLPPGGMADAGEGLLFGTSGFGGRIGGKAMLLGVNVGASAGALQLQII